MTTLRSRDIFEDPNVSDFSLYAYQATSVQWMRFQEFNLLNDGCIAGGINSDEMGLGKTRQYVALCEANLVPTTLVIAPNNILTQVALEFLNLSKRINVFKIEDQFFSYITLKPGSNTEIVIKKLKPNKNQSIWFPCVVLANSKTLESSNNQKLVNKFEWYRVIIDEAHILRNGDNTIFYEAQLAIRQPTIEINGIKKRLGSRFAITGTPIQNDPRDVVSLFRSIDSRLFTNANHNLDEVKYYISKGLFRRSRNQISPYMKKMINFPEFEPNITMSYIEFADTELARYVAALSSEQIFDEFTKNSKFKYDLLRDEKAFIIAKVAQTHSVGHQSSSLMNQQQLLSEPFQDGYNGEQYLGKKTKVERIINIIQAHRGESFVVFHSYFKIRNSIKALLVELFPEYVFHELSGEIEDLNKRHEILMACNESIDNGIPVILFSLTKATSEGLNYQKFSHMLILDQDANPQNEMQAITRIYRIGQMRQVHIWILGIKMINFYYGSISIDKRLEEIKDMKRPYSELIDENAAKYFRRYHFVNNLGERESGTFFGSEFERTPPGIPGGHDSVGPIQIR